MQLDMRFSSGTTPSARRVLSEVVRSTLERFSSRVRHVQCSVADINGPRGGIDKQCRCVVHLNHMAPIVIEDKDSSVGGVLHRVLERATYVLSQRINEKQSRSQRALSVGHVSAELLELEHAN